MVTSGAWGAQQETESLHWGSPPVSFPDRNFGRSVESVARAWPPRLTGVSSSSIASRANCKAHGCGAPYRDCVGRGRAVFRRPNDGPLRSLNFLLPGHSVADRHREPGDFPSAFASEIIECSSPEAVFTSSATRSSTESSSQGSDFRWPVDHRHSGSHPLKGVFRSRSQRSVFSRH